MASLTETAKAILMKESDDPTPDRGAETKTPNALTLRPGSRGVVGKFANPDAEVPTTDVEDLGPALVSPTGESGPANSSKRGKKDSSRSSVSAVAAEKVKSQAEVMEEDVEISEELESFIEQMIEEGHSEDEIMEAINDNFELISEEDELDEEQLDELRGASKVDPMKLFAARDKQASKAYKDMHNLRDTGDERGAKRREKEGDTAARKANDNYNRVRPMKEEDEYQVDMSEHVEALLSGEDLSEDFRQKATTIFEAAVKQKLEEEVAILEKAFEQTLEEEVERIQEELSNNVDDYLNYVVEQWVTDNEVAIQESLRTELTEDFISGLRNLFAENYIDIPEDKVNVVEELAGKVDELEGKLNEEIERNVALNKVLSESMRVEVLNDSLDGLTDTQAEKLKALAEGIDYTDVDQYKNKVKTLRENYFPSSIANPSEPLDQAVSASAGRSMISEETGPMAKYVQVLGKTLPT